MDKMDLRLLSEHDAADYLDLRLQALKSAPWAFGSDYESERAAGIDLVERRLSDRSAYTYGAYDGEELVGIATLFPERKQKLRHAANVFAVFVRDEYRSKGIGRALMNRIIAKAEELPEIEQLFLEVTSQNAPAIALYERLGFSVYGERPRVLKIDGTYYDEKLMVRFLL